MSEVGELREGAGELLQHEHKEDKINNNLQK